MRPLVQEGMAVPHGYRQDQDAFGPAHAAGGCVPHDPPTRQGCWNSHASGMPYLPSDGHHGLSGEWGTLLKAQFMTAHESSRTTGLYDRCRDEVMLDEVERISI